MNDITLLDGGMGQELLARVDDEPTSLWSTRVMVDHPGLVGEVHRDYFAAGATIATVNSYALHVDRLPGTDLEGRQAELIDMAVSEAEAARDAQGAGRIAGAIGPLGWSYDPNAHPDLESARVLYAEVARLLAPRVDLILCETVASVGHARAILAAARESGKPVWLALTVDDEDGSKLRSGEPVADLADLQPDAWLANCSAPEAMAAALAVFASWNKPFGAYANGFKEITKAFLSAQSTVTELSPRNITPEVYADFVMDWVAQGATIVGGCCEIGPRHIRAIADRLTAAGHTIV